MIYKGYNDTESHVLPSIPTPAKYQNLVVCKYDASHLKVFSSFVSTVSWRNNRNKQLHFKAKASKGVNINNKNCEKSLEIVTYIDFYNCLFIFSFLLASTYVIPVYHSYSLKLHNFPISIHILCHILINLLKIIYLFHLCNAYVLTIISSSFSKTEWLVGLCGLKFYNLNLPFSSYNKG